MVTNLEQQISTLGKEFFAAISGEAPSIFNKDWWTGKVLDWAMENEHFKTKLFHFVDVMPSLYSEESFFRHVEEYFGGDDQDVPAILRWSAKHAGWGGKITARLLSSSLRKNIETMARQFMVGKDTEEALKSLSALRMQGFTITVDILGEAAVSEKEARGHQQNYLDLLDKLAIEAKSWRSLGSAPADHLDWHDSPQINISVKPTSLYSQAHPIDWQNSVDAIYRRFIPLIHKAKEINAFIYIDMEQYLFKDLTLEVYRQLRSSKEGRSFQNLGLVLQAYLPETETDIDELIGWARENSLPINIRLVKGAYWDYETIIARQKGHPVPVYQVKAASDASFERCSKKILANHDICYFACASHNIRSIAATLATAREMKVPEERYEFQVLYGMAGPVRRALLQITNKVRLYCPYGELLPGMGYLVRRLLENTANESFLRQSFVDRLEVDQLLADPAQAIPPTEPQTLAEPTGKPFTNEPAPDFTKASLRADFQRAIKAAKKQTGKTYSILINNRDIKTPKLIESVNPAEPTKIIGKICLARQAEVDLAIEAAKSAFDSWQHTTPPQRAAFLFKAATKMREQLIDLAAWQVIEVGKQWEQAYMDVAEAIDFLEYYGREIIRLEQANPIRNPLGEENTYQYQGKGLAAVIAPWNFPLAISCGMSAAAIAAGNCVLYKPSCLSPVVGRQLADIFRECGLPDGVFNFLPGHGEEIGTYMVEHPDINIIAFTGSAEVGLNIIMRTTGLHGSNHIKKIITEMGGKNAIIIDDDADLDQAVPQVLYSAFGYQGQKCSACSRVIVLNDVYQKFVERLVEAAHSLSIGPADDPSCFMGPVVDERARKKINQYIKLAAQEGTILLHRETPEQGYYVPMTIVEAETESRVAMEEIFGPILTILKAGDFREAISIANSTPYALTGGVFSRSPGHLALAKRDFKVGNLYLNRGTTGALVYRQPFGGFRLSGLGSKAGGPDYLLQFMDSVVVTENTMRRGFTSGVAIPQVVVG